VTDFFVSTVIVPSLANVAFGCLVRLPAFSLSLLYLVTIGKKASVTGQLQQL
jgi:hypothetical protein